MTTGFLVLEEFKIYIKNTSEPAKTHNHIQIVAASSIYLIIHTNEIPQDYGQQIHGFADGSSIPIFASLLPGSC